MEYVSKRLIADKLYSPGLVVAGLRGGSGKTIFSVGIIAALRGLGISVSPFKKGPDYIDAGWLALAAGRSCHNLDTFMIDLDVILSSYYRNTNCSDISVVEGNRGLYDCINTKGETSTAALAKLLKLPVILCVDVTKTTITMAAVISGILGFDSRVCIGGVVLNRVAGTRHESILTRSIEQYCGIPILGAVPKIAHEFFPERHMGLVPTFEHNWAKDSIKSICNIANKYLDIVSILNITGYSKINKRDSNDKSINFNIDKELSRNQMPVCENYESIKFNTLATKPVIGVMRDSAFQFYYPENFEALENAGANLIFISPLDSKIMPYVDALYIGGGFPETHVERLEENIYIKNKVKLLAEAGLPIYGECGGLIYLGEKLLVGERSFNMSGVLPIVFKISKRPQGHGYTIIKVEKENPYFPVGSELLGHEFHYSSVHEWRGLESQLAFSMKRGSGLVNGKEGVVYKNVLATYTHIHALGTRNWATAFVSKAIECMKLKNKGSVPF